MKFSSCDVFVSSTWEIILAMLSKLLWTRSLIASYFYFLIANILKSFCIVVVAREKSRLVPFNALKTGTPGTLASTAIETSLEINVDVIKLASLTL